MGANPLFLAKWNVQVFGSEYVKEESSFEMNCWHQLSPRDQMNIFVCQKLVEVLRILLSCREIIKTEQITQVIFDKHFAEIKKTLADLQIDFICISILKFMCIALILVKNIETAMVYLRSLDFLCDVSEHHKTLTWALEQTGLCYRNLRLHNRAINTFQKIVQFAILQKSTPTLITAFDNLGVENYYLDDILKSKRYHSKAMLDPNIDTDSIFSPLKQRFEAEKNRVKAIFARKPPLFKLDLIFTILANYEIWNIDNSYDEYRTNLGVYEEEAILNCKKHSQALEESDPLAI